MNIWKKTLRRVLACVLAFSTAAISATIRADAAMVPNAEVRISWNDTAQEIDGFGVSQPCDVYGDEIYNHPKRDEIMDLLFSKDNGIGLSLLRCEVGNGRNMPTIEPQDGVWDFSGSAAELWVMNEAKTRGIDKIYSTVWSPPAWMKTNNKVTNGGYLRKDCYQKYAEYLKRYVEGYKQYHDIDIHCQRAGICSNLAVLFMEAGNAYRLFGQFPCAGACGKQYQCECYRWRKRPVERIHGNERT